MTRDDSTPRPARTARATSVSRSAMVLAAAALTAVSLTACNKMSDQQTDRSYAPADGIDVTLGKVDVRDLKLVAADEGGDGVLAGLMVNNGGKDAEVSFSFPGEGTPVKATVAAGQAISIDAQHMTMTKVPAKPGAMVNILVATPSSGEQTPLVPVLPPVGPYSSLTAAPAGSATPTSTQDTTPAPALATQTTAPAAEGTTTPPAATETTAPAATATTSS